MGYYTIGPHEILSRLPGVSVKRVSNQPGGLVRTCSNLILTAEFTLPEVTHADVLLIPGAGNATTPRDYPEVIAWIRKIHSTTTWTTSIFTGRRTYNRTTSDNPLGCRGAKPINKRIVEAKKIITAAGVSHGAKPCSQNIRTGNSRNFTAWY